MRHHDESPAKSPHDPASIWIAFGIFLMLWVFGMAFFHTLGGLLHLLLFAALVVLIGRTYCIRRSA